MDAQFVYLVDHLVINSSAGLAVPVLQDLFDGEVSKLVLTKLDHAP